MYICLPVRNVSVCWVIIGHFCAIDFVGLDCEIPCMDDQGEFVDPKDGTDYHTPVKPVFECVKQDGTSYTAWFGYVNDNNNNIYITATSENFLLGTSLGTPPTKFEPGTVKYAFSVG